MATRGTLERLSWGVYRVPHFPISTFAEYMEACFWPAGVLGVIATTVRRAIEDCYRTRLGPALLRQAIDAGPMKGRLAPTEAKSLGHDLSEWYSL